VAPISGGITPRSGRCPGLWNLWAGPGWEIRPPVFPVHRSDRDLDLDLITLTLDALARAGI
jgi:hypothetical protein